MGCRQSRATGGYWNKKGVSELPMRPENPHWEALGRWQGWAKDGKWQGQRGERWAGELGTYENAGSKSKGDWKWLEKGMRGKLKQVGGY